MKEEIEKLKGGNHKKLIENLVLFLILIIIIIIVMNTLFKEEKEVSDSKSVPVINTSELDKTDDLEENLKRILSKVNGVGKVEVMVSYVSGVQQVPMYDLKEGTTITEEKDTGGGERKIEQKDYEKTVIYEDKNGAKVPMIEQTITPKVTGVIVVAEGANNAVVKNNIIKAVEAAVDVASHKIQVLEMKKS